MLREFTLEYWQDDGWYVGRLKEIPKVFSQGETLEELRNQIKDAYQFCWRKVHLRFARIYNNWLLRWKCETWSSDS